ncbi:hypothetical protein DFS34DRAFT_123691 [Phlyctochytrium arcticum]|nr:hypothetical protein DFS34DRAFT_123691 [Phlyctochytrium arcticum]
MIYHILNVALVNTHSRVSYTVTYFALEQLVLWLVLVCHFMWPRFWSQPLNFPKTFPRHFNKYGQRMMGDGAFQNGHRSAPGTPKAGRKSVGPKNNLAVESTSEDRTEVESRLQRFIIGVLDYEAIKLGAAALYISPERSLSVDKFSTDIAGAFDLLTRNVVLQTWVDLLKGPVENPSLFPIEAAIQRKWKELLKNAPIELVEQAETTFLSSYVRIFRPRNFFIFCKPLLLIEGQPWEFFVTNRCVKLVAVSPEEEEAIIKLKQTKKHSAQDEFDFADLALINLNLSRPNYEEIARKVVSNRLSLQEGQLPPSMEDQRPRPNLSEAAYAALGSFQEILYEKASIPDTRFY